LHGRWAVYCTVGGLLLCCYMCCVIIIARPVGRSLHGRWAVCYTVGGLLLCYMYIVFSGFVIWSVIDVWNLPLEGEC
jgi:hypothetical protein